MATWCIAFVCVLLIPLIMLCFGIMMIKSTEKLLGEVTGESVVAASKTKCIVKFLEFGIYDLIDQTFKREKRHSDPGITTFLDRDELT